jgi:hypothetical protein
LHGDCEERLDEERGAEVRAEPVEDPAIVSVEMSSRRLSKAGEKTYFRILATSMISGMSSEKPAELRVLWIE